MICSNCGKELKDTAKFCNKCGAKVPSDSVSTVQQEQDTSPVVDVLDEEHESNKTVYLVGFFLLAGIAAFFAYLINNPKVEYGSFFDSRDGKTYRTVVIGTQTWMADNLDYDMPKNSRSSDKPGFGHAYTWKAAKKACPSGWHLPSKGEYYTLLEFINRDKDEFVNHSKHGKDLMSRSWGGSNKTGFDALPFGGRDMGSLKRKWGEIIDGEASFWTSTFPTDDDCEYDGPCGWDPSRGFFATIFPSGEAYVVYSFGDEFARARPVRCIKN